MSAGSSFNASSADASAASQALTTFCSATVSCTEDTIRSALTNFYSKCSAELAGGANKDVTLIYDTIYALLPYKAALCSKGDDGKLCAVSGPASTTVPMASGGSMPAQEVLQSMGSTSPNATTFASTNMLFLFLNPSTPKETLCTACTRNVLTSYITFESKNSYGPGFAGSVLLAGQSALYSAIKSNCPANFLEGQLQAAGGLSGGLAGDSNAATPTAMSGGVAVLAVIFSALAATAF